MSDGLTTALDAIRATNARHLEFQQNIRLAVGLAQRADDPAMYRQAIEACATALRMLDE